MLDIKDLRKQSLPELKAMVQDLSKEIYDLKTELSIARKIDKPHLLRDKKRDRARVMTVINSLGQSLDRSQSEVSSVEAAPKKPKKKAAAKRAPAKTQAKKKVEK